jgi:hypothetical protein
MVDHFEKEKFHAKWKKELKALAKRLGLETGQYAIRSNKAGCAIMGEVTLHADKFYMLVTTDSFCDVLYRSCNGQRDYTGGPNQYAHFQAITSGTIDPALRRMMQA